MRNIFQTFFLLGVVVLLLNPSTAKAAQKAKVIEDTQLLEAASEDATSVESLTEGDTILVSNKPIKGFFKARTRTGKKGFVKQSTVKTKSAEPIESIRPADQMDGDTGEVGESETSAPRDTSRAKLSGNSVRIMIGMSFFNMTELATLIADSGLSISNGIQAGAEFGLGLGGGLSLILRAELLLKSIVANDPAQGLDLSLSATSVPVSLGLGYQFNLSQRMVLEIAGYGGVGLLTKFSSTQTNAAEPNVTTLSATPINILGKLMLEYKFNPRGKLSLLFEVAYRIQKTADLIPADPIGTVNGSALFQVGGTGPYDPQPINFSGLSAVAGIAIRL